MTYLKWWYCVALCFLLVGNNTSEDLLASNDLSGECVQQETQELMQKNLIDAYVEKYGTLRVLKKSICLMDGSSVDIVDRVEYGPERISVVRDAVVGILRASRMHLKLPSELTEESLDSSRWELDKGALHFDSYSTTMIEEMFTSGAVEISRGADAQVLSVGLGAGYINSYLHHHFPKMNITAVDIDPAMLQIAREWFDLKEDDRHRVIIEDGLKYMERALESGIQYDVVHLDACTTHLGAKFICPLGDFVADEAIKVLSNLTSSRGAVIINVISLQYSPGMLANEILSCSHGKRPEGLDVKIQKMDG